MFKKWSEILKEINSFYTKSGRRYFFYNIEEAEEQAVVVLLYERGSMSENHDEKGLSHLLEHILLGFDKYNPDHRIKCSGYTDFFCTYYMFAMEVKYLEICLDIIEKIISGRYFDENTFDDIKRDVIKEYEDTMDCIYTKEFTCLLEDTEYMEHLAIGDMDVIQSCGYSELQNFHKKNYEEPYIDIIIMGNGKLTKKLKLLIESAQLLFVTKREIKVPSFPRSRFEWLNVKNREGFSAYFYRRRRKLDKNKYIKEYILDEICFSLFETVISDMYEGTKARVNKIIFSSADEFIGIHLDNSCIRNIIELKKVLENIVGFVNVPYIHAFILKFKKEYNDSLDSGYKINLVNEMKRCIQNLIYDGYILGNKEMIKMIILEIESININEITSRFDKLINFDADFYIYKVIDCNRDKSVF